MNERRQRFIAYFDRVWKDNGGRKAFMLKTGMKKARVSQLFDEAQPFGEQAGRRLTEALNLPSNYFDPTNAELSEQARQLALTFDKIHDGPEKARMFAVVLAAFESMSES